MQKHQQAVARLVANDIKPTKQYRDGYLAELVVKYRVFLSSYAILKCISQTEKYLNVKSIYFSTSLSGTIFHRKLFIKIHMRSKYVIQIYNQVIFSTLYIARLTNINSK